MNKIDAPKKGESLFNLWEHVEACVKVLNALLNFRIVTNSGRNKLTITEANATLELNIAAVVAAVVARRNWQPYPAPNQGGLSLKIRECFFHDGRRAWFASNKNASFAVPPGQTDGYYFWAVLEIGPNGQITAFYYDKGPDGPPAPPAPNLTTGAPPAVAYYPLFYVTSNATAIDDFSNVLAPDRPINLVPKQVSVPGSQVASTFLLFFDPKEDT